MSDEEIIVLREWVAEDNSVFTNSSMTVNNRGRQLDFQGNYRYDAEVCKELSQLTGKKREMYLTVLCSEDIVDTLGEDLYKQLEETYQYKSIDALI